MQLQTIQSKIYEVRGQKVMLDFDLEERLKEPEGKFFDVSQAIDYLIQKDKQDEQKEILSKDTRHTDFSWTNPGFDA